MKYGGLPHIIPKLILIGSLWHLRTRIPAFRCPCASSQELPLKLQIVVNCALQAPTSVFLSHVVSLTLRMRICELANSYITCYPFIWTMSYQVCIFILSLWIKMCYITPYLILLVFINYLMEVHKHLFLTLDHLLCIFICGRFTWFASLSCHTERKVKSTFKGKRMNKGKRK